MYGKMEGVGEEGGFLTDEVETHALEEIHLEIHKGQYISISGPSGCGSSPSCLFWVYWTRPRMGTIF